uniref:Uncharacterized protein n=1 Tax=Anguilla anguilla TaxID=7936 RepID=A0A0E9TPV7_ANGAN
MRHNIKYCKVLMTLSLKKKQRTRK